jgi:hypothetical protein
MQIQPEHRRPARDQISFIPSGEIAAGIPLKQRIAIPDRRRDQQNRNGDGGGPDQAGFGQAGAQNMRMDVAFPPFWGSLPGTGRVPKSANSRVYPA